MPGCRGLGGKPAYNMSSLPGLGGPCCGLGAGVLKCYCVGRRRLGVVVSALNEAEGHKTG